jgi:ribosomal protein S18 acetylase RimI-like enzyme
MPTIRPITLDDRAAWQPLWDAYLVFYETDLAPEITDDVFARLTKHTELRGAIAWGEDGEALGLVHWLFHPATWSMTDYCYLSDLYVSPAARGLGIARALIQHVNDDASSAGVQRVYWHTHETNTTAQALYNRVATRTGHIEFEQTVR